MCELEQTVHGTNSAPDFTKILSVVFELSYGRKNSLCDPDRFQNRLRRKMREREEYSQNVTISCSAPKTNIKKSLRMNFRRIRRTQTCRKLRLLSYHFLGETEEYHEKQ